MDMRKYYMVEQVSLGSKRKDSTWHVIDIIMTADPARACYKYRVILNNKNIYQTPVIEGKVIV